MAKQYDGPYRVTVVAVDGAPRTIKVVKWADASCCFQDAVASSSTVWAGIFELSDDPFHFGLRESWSASERKI